MLANVVAASVAVTLLTTTARALTSTCSYLDVVLPDCPHYVQCQMQRVPPEGMLEACRWRWQCSGLKIQSDKSANWADDSTPMPSPAPPSWAADLCAAPLNGRRGRERCLGSCGALGPAHSCCHFDPACDDGRCPAPGAVGGGFVPPGHDLHVLMALRVRGGNPRVGVRMLTHADNRDPLVPRLVRLAGEAPPDWRPRGGGRNHASGGGRCLSSGCAFEEVGKGALGGDDTTGPLAPGLYQLVLTPRTVTLKEAKAHKREYTNVPFWLTVTADGAWSQEQAGAGGGLSLLTKSTLALLAGGALFLGWKYYSTRHDARGGNWRSEQWEEGSGLLARGRRRLAWAWDNALRWQQGSRRSALRHEHLSDGVELSAAAGGAQDFLEDDGGGPDDENPYGSSGSEDDGDGDAGAAAVAQI